MCQFFSHEQFITDRPWEVKRKELEQKVSAWLEKGNQIKRVVLLWDKQVMQFKPQVVYDSDDFRIQFPLNPPVSLDQMAQ